MKLQLDSEFKIPAFAFSKGRLGPRVAEPQAEPRKLHSFSKSESLSFPNVQVTSSIVFDAPVDDVALPVEP